MGLIVFGALIIHDTPVMIEAFRSGAYEGSNAFRMPIGPVRLIAIVLWLVTAAVIARHAWRILIGHGRPDVPQTSPSPVKKGRS